MLFHIIYELLLGLDIKSYTRCFSFFRHHIVYELLSSGYLVYLIQGVYDIRKGKRRILGRSRGSKRCYTATRAPSRKVYELRSELLDASPEASMRELVELQRKLQAPICQLFGEFLVVFGCFRIRNGTKMHRNDRFKAYFRVVHVCSIIFDAFLHSLST